MEFFAEFMPHGACYRWTPSVLATHVVSDVLIGLAYYSIPLALIVLVRKRRDLPFSWIFVLFGAFILACGTTHLVDVWTTWSGRYGVEGLAKATTAAISLVTAALVWPLLPRALALPSPQQLAAANQALREEIAQRRQAEVALQAQARELEAARDAAEAASRAKSVFLANMSHEIRTPLNAVIGLSESLLESELDALQRDRVGTVLDSGEQLLHVVDDVLDFSKIEAGRLALERISFEVEGAVERTIHALSQRAERKDLALSWHIAPDVPRVVCGDPTRLRQVLANLVSNAITCTEQGGVTVEVERAASGPDVLIRFRVRDTGTGIEPSQIRRLFEPFEQGDASTTRRHGGTGLGLSICRRLVELMGGEIGCESELGVGSTFTFTARFAPPDEATQQSERAELPPLESAAVAPLRVLLVEDSVANQKVALAILERQGHRVRVAADGRQAVELFAGERFDVVLMDIQMPVMDGYACTAALRNAEAGSGRHTPIVAMTAYALRGDRERCLAAGMDDHVAKPVRRAELLRVLGELARTRAEA